MENRAAVRARHRGYLARLRVRVRRDSLDRRLAAGEVPRTDPDLSLRAEELTEVAARRRIAMVIYRLIDEAAGTPAPVSSKVPRGTSQVDINRTTTVHLDRLWAAQVDSRAPA